MTQVQLFRAIGAVDADLVMEAEAARRTGTNLRVVAARWGAAAACLALVTALGISRLQQATPQLVPQPSTMRAEGITPFSSPMGMRKFFHYNGYRYAFLEDGAVYNLAGLRVANHLGTLEYDLLAGLNGVGEDEYASMDLATTFALAGELYELPGYQPAFRLAVLWEGEYYLAELVGTADDAPLDAGYYFEVSSLQSLVEKIEILPHMGGEALHTIHKKSERQELLRLLSQAEPAQLSGEDYLAIAAAQNLGQSWQLKAALSDGTSVSFYITPELGFVSIADSTYTLPDEFLTRYAGVFSNLEQAAPPLY